MQPKVSIIIPVYNAEKYLLRCVDSLVNQTLKEIEIILVDDFSTDNSGILCDELALKDERIKVIHKKNEGAGFARNAGIEIAKGKYIGFVDSDDYVDVKMYESMYNVAEKYSTDFVMSSVILIGGNVFSKEGEVSVKTYFDTDTLFETERDIKNLFLGTLGSLPNEKEDTKYGTSVWKNLFKKEIIDNNNLKFMSEREMLSEDALFIMDYIKCIKSAVGIKEAYYYYVRNEVSISNSYKKDRFEKSMIFASEVEKRLINYIPYNEYKIYLDRFIQSFARFVCSQEVMYAKKMGIKYSLLKERLKMVCTHKTTESVLKTYPISELPLKQAVFAFAMKHKLYFMQKIVVLLRDR